MKLSELKSNKGTYAALRVLQPAGNLLYDYCREVGIPVRKSQFDDRLHTTLIYSRVYCPHLFAEPGIIYNATFSGFDIFSDDKGRNVLVALLNAPEVVARHIALMAKHGASYDFPVYHPHITLCYDYPRNYTEGLVPINFPISLGKEYVEDLDLGWE